MKTKKSQIVVELVYAVLSVCAIYLAIWLTGFQDPARRWTLLVSLLGIWLSFYIGRSVASRAITTNTGQGLMPTGPLRPGRVWGFACVIALMLLIGGILRLTT